MSAPQPIAAYRQLLAEHRDQILAALAYALGCTRAELLARLGIQRAADLTIADSTRRGRGRPRREIDRVAVVAALRAHEGAIKPAATALDVPRMTLTRFLARGGVQAWEWQYGSAVSSAHAQILHASAISPDVARSRGYRSVDGGSELTALGFTRAGSMANRAGLLMPVHSVRGHVAWYQLRCDEPFRRWLGSPGAWRKSGLQRYANPKDATPVLDVSPRARARVLDASEPLWITEGIRKADAAASVGLAVAAVLGVRMIPEPAHQDWTYLGLDGRDVILALDSDAASNPEVRTAEDALRRFLAKRGARVRIVRLPTVGNKTGLDDFLAREGKDALLALARGDAPTAATSAKEPTRAKTPTAAPTPSAPTPAAPTRAKEPTPAAPRPARFDDFADEYVLGRDREREEHARRRRR